MKIPDSVSHKIFQYLQAQNTNRLMEGDVFTGRVIAVDGDFLLMQLFDGREISAQVNSGTYNPGDILKLKVIDMQQGRLMTTKVEHYPAQNGEAVTTETGHYAVQNNVIIEKEAEQKIQSSVYNEKTDNPAEILKSMDLPVNKLSIEIVNAILEMGREPTAEIIEKALHIIENMHVENPEHAVFLILNGLEDEEQYYSVIRDLARERFHFAEELNNLINLLDSADDEPLSGFSERIRSALSNSLVKTRLLCENPLQQHGVNIDSEFLKTDEIALPKVDQWINELKKELSLLGRFIANSAVNDKEEIMSAVNRLETAIHFFNDLQCFEMFVQIPLFLKETQTNAELYIMKRSGRKGKINSRNFTLLLTLATDNIGDLDIFVHVKNKNVLVKIFAENERFNHLFINEYKFLYNALKEKGYNLFDLDFELKDEKVNMFNAEKKALSLLNINKTKIDIRV